jgi:hypothetical protein
LVKTSTNKNLGVERPPLRGNIRLFSFGKKFFYFVAERSSTVEGPAKHFIFTADKFWVHGDGTTALYVK